MREADYARVFRGFRVFESNSVDIAEAEVGLLSMHVESATPYHSDEGGGEGGGLTSCLNLR